VKAFLHSLEPLWWGLFVTSTFVSALLLPGWLIVVLVWPEVLEHAHMHALASSLIGRAVVFGLVATCLWNGAHHLRHFHIDMGGLRRDTPVALGLYAIAGLGSLAALFAVVRL